MRGLCVFGAVVAVVAAAVAGSGSGRAVEREHSALTGVAWLAGTKTGADRAGDPAVEGGRAPALDYEISAAPPTHGRLLLELRYTRRSGGWLEVSDLDGANRWVLTRPPRKGVARQDSGAVWSPDGNRVAFVRDTVRGEKRRSAIFVVDADGSGLRRVVGTDRLRQYIGGIVWSDDGTKLAFDRLADCDNPQRPSEVGLYVVNVDGSGLRELPVLAPYAATLRTEPVSLTAHEWSSDGTSLLYVVHRYWSGDTLCRADMIESSDLRSVGAGGQADALLASRSSISNVQSSPDGRSIAFTAYAANQSGDSCSLYVLDSDGSVTSVVREDYVLYGCAAGYFSFVWSDDGREIAYSSQGANVDAIDLQSGQPRRVFTGSPSPPCNETGELSDESAPCSLRILALAQDGSRILIEQDAAGLRTMPLALASFDGTSSLTLPKPTAGRARARIAAFSAHLP